MTDDPITPAVRQVTELLLDPATVRVWPGNARSYRHLTADSCAELIDSIVAEGGQKVPAVVRRIEGDADHGYEVIASTRRHWAVSWLRAHSCPDMPFVAQVAQLDDEAALRLADIENRAWADVSDLERASNYAAALHGHYGGHRLLLPRRCARTGRPVPGAASDQCAAAEGGYFGLSDDPEDRGCSLGLARVRGGTARQPARRRVTCRRFA